MGREIDCPSRFSFLNCFIFSSEGHHSPNSPFLADERMETQFSRSEMTFTRAKETAIELSASRTTLYVTRCSRDGRFVFVSRACAEFLGRRLEEVVGRPIAEILDADAMAAIAPQIERVLRVEEVEFEAEISYAYSGRPFMHVFYTPDRNERGEVIGWIASIVDVTDRKAHQGGNPPGARCAAGRRVAGECNVHRDSGKPGGIRDVGAFDLSLKPYHEDELSPDTTRQ